MKQPLRTFYALSPHSFSAKLTTTRYSIDLSWFRFQLFPFLTVQFTILMFLACGIICSHLFQDFRGIEKLQEEMRQISIARRTSIPRREILALADSSLMLFRVGVLFCSEIAADSQAIKVCRAKYEKLGARVRLGILDNPGGGAVQTTGLTQLLGVLPF